MLVLRAGVEHLDATVGSQRLASRMLVLRAGVEHLDASVGAGVGISDAVRRALVLRISDAG